MNTGPVLVDVAVKDLKDAALDWVVGVVEGAKTLVDGRLRWVVGEYEVDYTPGQVNNPYMLQHRGYGYCPSTEWRIGGALRDKYRVEVLECGAEVHAKLAGHTNSAGCGDTALIAICRAIVTSKLGDIVKVPACLVMP